MANHRMLALVRRLGAPPMRCLRVVALLGFTIVPQATSSHELTQSSASSVTTEPQAFEVASVRPNVAGGAATSALRVFAGGRLSAVNVTLRDVIRFAYGLEDHQILEEGDFTLLGARFDIAAKAPVDPGPLQRGVLGPYHHMLQQLLAERFKLAVQWNNREQPVYALVLARRDQALGEHLRRSTIDCAAIQAARANTPAAERETVPLDRAASLRCAIMSQQGRVTAGGHTLQEIAAFFSRVLKREVQDRTGLVGPFEIDFTYSGRAGSGAARPDGSASDPLDSSLFTAVQEQLGLKFEAVRVPVRVLTVTSVSQPVPD